MRNFFLLTVSLFAAYNFSIAQIDGDNLFQNDQIINIELNFSQTSFWDSLVANYEESIYMKADLTLTDETGTYSFEDVGVRLKGNSSYGHPGNKKSLKIDFNKYVTGQDYDGIKKLNFSNAFKDPTLMREKLFFDACRDAEVPAPRSNFANVYFNGTLWGFYTMIEQIDDQFLDWKIEDDDGNLFKAGANFGVGPNGGGTPADLAYYGANQSDYEERYELKTNEEINDWSDLVSFIDFINNSSDADFESQLNDHLTVDDYITSLALDNLFSNLDSYTGSARNYYIYHNLTTGQWEWIKWDGNESFGSYGGGQGAPEMTSLDLDYHDNDRPLIERIFENDNFYAQYESAICFLIEDYFNPDVMNPKIDAMKLLIQNSVYADDNKMYSDSDFDTNIETNLGGGGGGPGGGNTYGLKSFISSKYNYVSGQLDCSVINGIEESQLKEVKIFPNPFQESLVVDLKDLNASRVVLTDCLGKVVRDFVPSNSLLSLDTSDLTSGVYFLQVELRSGVRAGYKVLKE